MGFIAKDSDGNIHPVKKDGLLTLLAQTESKYLDNYQASFVLLYRTFRYCNVLAERGALLPRLFKAGKENYRIQWIPALMNASVKKVFDDLLQWYPGDFIQISNPAASKKNKITKRDQILLPSKPEESLTLLCSFFANSSVQACYNNVWRNNKASNTKGSKIYELFFDNASHRFESFSEKEIPNTIQLWLNRFYISKKDYSPILQITEIENNNGFEVRSADKK